MHILHAVVLVSEVNMPDGQALQKVLPYVAKYWPAAQAVQDISLLFMILGKKPGSQYAQATPWPGMHGVQLAEPGVEIVCAGQIKHPDVPPSE